MHDCNGHEIRKHDVLEPVSGHLEKIRIIQISDIGPYAWFKGLNDTDSMKAGIITQFAIEATRRVRATTVLPDYKVPYKPRTDVLYPDELALRDELPDKDQLKLMDAWNEVDKFLKTIQEVD